MSRDLVVIRAMSAADVDRVMEIAGSQQNSSHWPRAMYLTALDPQAIPQRLALVLAEAGEDFPTGFAVASLLGPESELENIAITPERQGRGLGRMLLDRLLGDLKTAGVAEIWLEVRVSNARAIALYRRTGFEESGTRRAYYADPVEDARVMRLTIG